MSVYVGLMSGTSLDGISAAVVRFESATGVAGQPTGRAAEQLDFELLAFVSTEYTSQQRDRLHAALTQGTAREYCRLGFDLGTWLADATVAVLAEAGVPRSTVRAIGSHGQTIWHEAPHSTWQLGESAVIAERTGIDVVSDFRVRDVAAGGQGAPLVPIADALLFAGDDWRALQNIGGIGNVTVVPPNGQLDGVRAFDTGPGVSVIDAVTRTLIPGATYDVDGKQAAAGSPIDSVVGHLLQHPYFAAEPPKSTGRELFDQAYVRSLIERCREANPSATTADIIATATSLTARSIADSYQRFLPEPVTEVLVSGGGAKNPTLLSMIERSIAPLKVLPFAERFFDGEAKEAVAFALLAYLFVERRAGNVPRATGAKGPRILGKLTPA
ncbi:MAG TPA: anhydro-N-acetylmuramic acid kinase [Gemmatimonadaceae bacterium]|nr:anhydro-N-acetylmuramic acid kinase [Gemmatimonadaceae bacterium]